VEGVTAAQPRGTLHVTIEKDEELVISGYIANEKKVTRARTAQE
jgi:hypothetical protein